jgi:hypothetical protein
MINKCRSPCLQEQTIFSERIARSKALDVDAILAAQALTMTIAGDGDEVLIATSNVGHLARFPGIDAREWETIA